MGATGILSGLHRLAIVLIPCLTPGVFGQASSTALSFLIVGDWGGDDNSKPTTPGETCTASGMGKAASALGAEFVLALGDNFYESGINSRNTDRFQSTFENVYTADSLKVPWYVIAGNHDHLGVIQDQIDFHAKSERWNYPSEYYSFIKELPWGKTAEFVMFDSVWLVGQSYRDAESGAFVSATGPSNITAAQRQWSWLEATLANSKADFLFTACHYPVWSVCQHGNTLELVYRLRPLLQKYKVTAHLSGHDHCLMHIQEGQTDFVLSGAGAKAWYHASNMHRLGKHAELKWYMAKDNKGSRQGGFAAITLTNNSAQAAYYGDDGAQLYVSAPRPPRGAAGAPVSSMEADIVPAVIAV